MVINTYLKLEIGSKHSGTVLNAQQLYVPTTFIVLREITEKEYLDMLAESPFAWTIPDFKSHPDLNFYEVLSD